MTHNFDGRKVHLFEIWAKELDLPYDLVQKRLARSVNCKSVDKEHIMHLDRHPHNVESVCLTSSTGELNLGNRGCMARFVRVGQIARPFRFEVLGLYSEGERRENADAI